MLRLIFSGSLFVLACGSTDAPSAARTFGAGGGGREAVAGEAGDGSKPQAGERASAGADAEAGAGGQAQGSAGEASGGRFQAGSGSAGAPQAGAAGEATAGGAGGVPEPHGGAGGEPVALTGGEGGGPVLSEGGAAGEGPDVEAWRKCGDKLCNDDQVCVRNGGRYVCWTFGYLGNCDPTIQPHPLSAQADCCKNQPVGCSLAYHECDAMFDPESGKQCNMCSTVLEQWSCGRPLP